MHSTKWRCCYRRTLSYWWCPASQIISLMEKLFLFLFYHNRYFLVDFFSHITAIKYRMSKHFEVFKCGRLNSRGENLEISSSFCVMCKHEISKMKKKKKTHFSHYIISCLYRSLGPHYRSFVVALERRERWCIDLHDAKITSWWIRERPNVKVAPFCLNIFISTRFSTKRKEEIFKTVRIVYPHRLLGGLLGKSISLYFDFLSSSSWKKK